MGKVKKINAALDVAAANAEPIVAPIAAAAAISKKRGHRKRESSSFSKNGTRRRNRLFCSDELAQQSDHRTRKMSFSEDHTRSKFEVRVHALFHRSANTSNS